MSYSALSGPRCARAERARFRATAADQEPRHCKTVRVRRILVGFDGSDGGLRALERAIAEWRDSRTHITVLSVANVPLDPEAPRYFGTLDDISAREGAALAPPPDVR
jgi:hypothetical protein